MFAVDWTWSIDRHPITRRWFHTQAAANAFVTLVESRGGIAGIYEPT